MNKTKAKTSLRSSTRSKKRTLHEISPRESDDIFSDKENKSAEEDTNDPTLSVSDDINQMNIKSPKHNKNSKISSKSTKKTKKSKKDDSDDEYNVESEEPDSDNDLDNIDDPDDEDYDDTGSESPYEPPPKKRRRTTRSTAISSNSNNSNNNNNSNTPNSPKTRRKRTSSTTKKQSTLAQYLQDSDGSNATDTDSCDEDIDIDDMDDDEKVDALTKDNKKLRNKIKSLKKRVKSLEDDNKELRQQISANNGKSGQKSKRSGRGGNINNANNSNNNNNINSEKQKKQDAKYRSKMFAKWAKACARNANKKSNKFQRGYGTITVEDHITPEEFLLCFPKDCGYLIQPRKDNKPKSVVTIKSFDSWEKIEKLFNNEDIIGNGKNSEKNKITRELTVHVWSVGGINFSKSRYYGTDSAEIDSLNVCYNKSKMQLKLEFSASSNGEMGCGYRFGGFMFF